MMQRFNPIQRQFLKSFLSKLLMLPAFWFFFWAVYPLATSPYLQQGFDILFYLMLSLFNWLCFTVSVMGWAAIEMLIANPALRKSLIHLDRGKHTHTTISTADQKEKKEESLPLY